MLNDALYYNGTYMVKRTQKPYRTVQYKNSSEMLKNKRAKTKNNTFHQNVKKEHVQYLFSSTQGKFKLIICMCMHCNNTKSADVPLLCHGGTKSTGKSGSIIQIVRI
jgi:hypothetical protein